MKNLSLAILITGTALTFTSCKKQLDVNSDPDTPQDPGVHSVFQRNWQLFPAAFSMMHAISESTFRISILPSPPDLLVKLLWDRMGYQSGVDNGGDMWRQTYFGLGKNLNFIIDKGLKTGQWDYVGAAYALKAWSFQTITDLHGEAIYKEAFMENSGCIPVR